MRSIPLLLFLTSFAYYGDIQRPKSKISCLPTRRSTRAVDLCNGTKAAQYSTLARRVATALLECSRRMKLVHLFPRRLWFFICLIVQCTWSNTQSLPDYSFYLRRTQALLSAQSLKVVKISFRISTTCSCRVTWVAFARICVVMSS